MKFFFIKLRVIRGNIFLSLLDLNNNVIFFKTIKWFLKYKKIKKPKLKRYSLKILSSFVLYFFDLIRSFDKKFYYIIIFDNIKSFYSRFFLNAMTYNRIKLKIFKVFYLSRNSHGFMRKKKFRRL